MAGKVELASVVAKEVGISVRKAEQAVQVIIDEIKSRVRSGERVAFKDFGAFFQRAIKGYKTTNPLTKKEMLIKDRLVMKFRQFR